MFCQVDLKFKFTDFSQIIKFSPRAGDVAKLLACLSNMHEALGLIPTTRATNLQS